MLNCKWVHTLTKYDCTPVRGLRGEPGLRIGTPFSLPDNIAINIYVLDVGDGNFLFSDNGDTLAHLSALGLDLSPHDDSELREIVHAQGVTLGDDVDFNILSPQQHAEWSFARSITALLAVGQWAREKLPDEPEEHDRCVEVFNVRPLN